MPLSLVGTPTTAATGTSTSSVTINVPAGVQNGDLLLWDVVGVTGTLITGTPTGWILWHAATTTTLNRSIFYRIAASEPGSYTTAGATLVSSRWASTMTAIRGADPVTPEDVASASTAGTTTTTTTAITPVTTGAWVLGFMAQHFALGVPTGTAASTNLTVDGQIANTSGSSNALSCVGHFAWTSGAFTANMSNSGTTARTLGTRIAVRPGPTLAFVPVAETVAVTADTIRGRSGDAPVAASVDVTTTSTLGKSDSANVAEAVAVTATATHGAVGSADVAESVAVTADATLGKSVVANVTGSVTVTAGGTLGKVGDAPVSEAVTVTATGTRGAVGSANVAAAVAVTADATISASGAASVDAAVSVTASATLAANAFADVGFGVSVTATAEVTARVDPAPAWRTLTVPAESRTYVVPAESRTYSIPGA